MEYVKPFGVGFEEVITGDGLNGESKFDSKENIESSVANAVDENPIDVISSISGSRKYLLYNYHCPHIWRHDESSTQYVPIH